MKKAQKFSSDLVGMVIGTGLVLAGCSTGRFLPSSPPLSSHEVEVPSLNTPASGAESSQAPETEVEDLKQKLLVLAAAAKASGKHAVNYLATDIFLKASAASLEGDFATASLLYKHLVSLFPEDDFLKTKYAVELIRMGQLKPAEQELKIVFDRSKHKNERVGLVLAGIYTALSEKAKARDVYHQILKVNPKNEDACIFLSKSYVLDKNYKQAFSKLKSCENKNPKKAVFSFYRGKIYLDQGNVKKARRYFRRALNKDPLYYQAVLALGLLYEEEKKLEKAASFYENYLKNDPYNNVILSRIVHVYFLLENYSKVIAHMENLVNVEPDDLNLKLKLGILYTDAKRYKEAKLIFKGLLESVPDSDKILYYLGAIFQETEDYEEAISYFLKIPAYSELYNDSVLQTASMMKELALEDRNSEEKTERFLSYVDKRIADTPNVKIELAIFKAGYLEDIGNLSNAIQVLEGIKIEGEYKEGQQYYLASLYEKQKDYDRSTEIIMELVEKNPNNAHAWNFLGYSLLERGEDPEKALEYIQKAVALSPEDGYIRDSLGWYYYKMGKLEQALIELKKAREYAGEDAVISRHLGIVYKALKKYDQAQKYLVEALNNSKQESEREDLLQVMEELKVKARTPANQ